MNMKNIALFFAFVIVAIAVSAQSHIESAIKTVEKSQTTHNEIFSERRDPNTGKIARITRMMMISPQDAKHIIKAFESDRSSSSSYEYVRNEVYTIKFYSKNSIRNYSLIRDGRRWTLSVDIRNNITGEKKSRKVSYDQYDGYDESVLFDDNIMTIYMSI